MNSMLRPLIALACLLVMVTWLAFCKWLYSFYESYECKTKAQAMGVNYKYGLIQGCFIETKNGYVPYDKYRNIN